MNTLLCLIACALAALALREAIKARRLAEKPAEQVITLVYRRETPRRLSLLPIPDSNQLTQVPTDLYRYELPKGGN